MSLINAIKDSLVAEDQKILSSLDLSKTNEEIIDDMTKAKLLKFKKNDHENKKAEQAE
jgi:hypothetical protein